MKNSLAYFAGIIDGEASICYYVKPRMKKRAPRVAVSMISEATIRALYEHFGIGHVSYRLFKAPNRKPQWSWTVEHQLARKVLVKVFPYLIARRVEVQAILNDYV